MSDDIKKLRNELYDLKTRLRFWRVVASISVIDVPLIIAIILNIIGINHMNDADLDFVFIRVSGMLFVILSVIIMGVSNIYLMFNDECK